MDTGIPNEGVADPSGGAQGDQHVHDANGHLTEHPTDELQAVTGDVVGPAGDADEALGGLTFAQEEDDEEGPDGALWRLAGFVAAACVAAIVAAAILLGLPRAGKTTADSGLPGTSSSASSSSSDSLGVAAGSTSAQYPGSPSGSLTTSASKSATKSATKSASASKSSSPTPSTSHAATSSSAPSTTSVVPPPTTSVPVTSSSAPPPTRSVALSARSGHGSTCPKGNQCGVLTVTLVNFAPGSYVVRCSTSTGAVFATYTTSQDVSQCVDPNKQDTVQAVVDGITSNAAFYF